MQAALRFVGGTVNAATGQSEVRLESENGSLIEFSADLSVLKQIAAGLEMIIRRADSEVTLQGDRNFELVRPFQAADFRVGMSEDTLVLRFSLAGGSPVMFALPNQMAASLAQSIAQELDRPASPPQRN